MWRDINGTYTEWKQVRIKRRKGTKKRALDSGTT